MTNLFAPVPEITKPETKRLSRAEQVWNLVKNHPDRNAYELAEIYPEMPYGSISSMLSQLDSRGMIYVSGRRNHCRTYSTKMESFVMLERLPVVEESYTPIMGLPIQVVEPKEEQPQAPKPKVDLDSLTIGEAKELYGQLKVMFA